jgi:hypothetical protein
LIAPSNQKCLQTSGKSCKRNGAKRLVGQKPGYNSNSDNAGIAVNAANAANGGLGHQ